MVFKLIYGVFMKYLVFFISHFQVFNFLNIFLFLVVLLTKLIANKYDLIAFLLKKCLKFYLAFFFIIFCFV